MLEVEEELRNMGIEEKRSSFFYEKVAGRAGSKSVYRLSKTGAFEDEDKEFDLANGKMYIKDFDFTGMPPSEVEMVEQLQRFQDTVMFDSEPMQTCSLKIPIKRIEQVASTSSVA